MKKKTISITIFFTLMLLMTGCMDEAVDNEEDGEDESDSIETSQETFEWIAQSPWPDGTDLHDMAETIADDITELSGGRLQVEMRAADEIVGPFDLLDAVDQGTIDAAHSWDGYWVGQMPQVALFASVPMGMTHLEYLGWITTDEGRELWQQVYDEHNYNIRVIDAGGGTGEIFYHSNEPIRTLEDLEGMRVRAVGEWADILERIGASVVNVDGGEVYQSLERGVVDAIEYASPAQNYSMGFHEISDYVVTPAIHQDGNASSFLINNDKWEELPDDLKKIVRVATENMWGKGWAELAEADMEVMQEFRDLEDDGQLEIIEFEPESQEELQSIIEDYYEERAEDDELFGEIWESQQRYREEFQYWDDLMTPVY